MCCLAARPLESEETCSSTRTSSPVHTYALDLIRTYKVQCAKLLAFVLNLSSVRIQVVQRLQNVICTLEALFHDFASPPGRSDRASSDSNATVVVVGFCHSRPWGSPRLSLPSWMPMTSAHVMPAVHTPPSTTAGTRESTSAPGRPPPIDLLLCSAAYKFQPFPSFLPPTVPLESKLKTQPSRHTLSKPQDTTGVI